MKASFVAAVLLLAISFKPNALGAGTIPSKCDAISENLVVNCGFETGTFAGWSQDSGPCFCSIGEEARFSGNFGSEHAGPYYQDYITQLLPTVAGQQYSVSFWLWNTGQPNAFRMQWEGVTVYESVDAPDFPWTQVQLDLVASQDRSEIRFEFYNEPGWWFFDDVVVVPSPK